MTMQRLKAGVIGTTLLGVFSPLALAGTSVTIGPVDAASVAVPTMSSSLMIGLGLLLAIIALRALKQYGGAAKVLCLAIFGGGLVVGGIGVERSVATSESVRAGSSVCDGGTQTISTGRPYDDHYIDNDCESTTFQIKSYNLPCTPAEQIKYNADVGTTHAPGTTAQMNNCPREPE